MKVLLRKVASQEEWCHFLGDSVDDKMSAMTSRKLVLGRREATTKKEMEKKKRRGGKDFLVILL